MRQPCPHCGRVHAADEVATLNRFRPGERYFQARYEGAPIRVIRDHAEEDMCRHYQQKGSKQ